ncbi:MAG: ABC transporter permease [Anaerolineae bacterium]|nr:ABC transporter permease [Anaerolineae bacterium]
MRRLPRAWVGAALVIAALSAAIFAPVIAPADPTFQFRDGLSNVGLPLAPGTGRFLLGTDNLGRDMLSRILYGAQVSLFVSLVANTLAAGIGTSVGVTAGYFPGSVLDSLLMRFTDVLMAFPAILLALGLAAVLRPSAVVVTVIIAVITWPALARIVRSQVLLVRELAFVESARSIGAGDPYIITRHILPNILMLVVIWATLSLPNTVLLETALSYLGVGVPPPTASWGNMIADGQTYYRNAPWLILLPGAAILVTTLGFNLLGDALRDALDPRTIYRA